MHWENKIRLSFRSSSGSEKSGRFQNNLLLAETLNLLTKLTLLGHKAINQALTPFESIGVFFIPEFPFCNRIQESFAR